MDLRRVVVTGMGIVSPLGCGVDATWANILASKSGAKRIDDFEVSDIACQIAHRVPRGDYAAGGFNPDEWMDTKDQRKVDPFIIYAMAAAKQAIDDAGVEPKSKDEAERTGVLIGSGIGGLGGIYETSLILAEKGPRRVSPKRIDT
jgi:3-oxoacyl-[acyl-carrier-protein] synthase II